VGARVGLVPIPALAVFFVVMSVVGGMVSSSSSGAGAPSSIGADQLGRGPTIAGEPGPDAHVGLVSLAAVARDAVGADFDFGGVAEVHLVEVLGGDGQGGQLGEGGGRAEAAAFDVLDGVV
jgi:hypothetical protein